MNDDVRALSLEALQQRASELAQLVLQAGLHGVDVSEDVLAERRAVDDELDGRARTAR